MKKTVAFDADRLYNDGDLWGTMGNITGNGSTVLPSIFMKGEIEVPAGPVQECLCGTELRKIDSAGRLSIPAGFRSRFGSSVYLLKALSGDKCLIVYTEEGWLSYYNGLSAKYEGRALVVKQRRSIGNSKRSLVDKDGRIIISPDFLDFAGVENEALVVCYPDRVEIWSEENWHRALEDFEEDDVEWTPT